MSAVFSTWKLLTGLGPDQAQLLAEWHLLALLGGLGLLAAFGLHWLVGHVFRFYRRGEKRLWYVAALTLPVLVVSVGVWLASYLLGTGADRLAAGLTRPPGEAAPRLSEALGEALLAPALGELPAAPRGPQPAPEAAPAPEAQPAPQTPDAEDGDTPEAQAAPEGDAEADAGAGEEGAPAPDAEPGTQGPADGGDAAPGPQNAPPGTGQGGGPPRAGDAITLEELAEALEAMSPETLREAFSEPSDARPDGAAQATVLAIALEWIGDPDQVWPEWPVTGIPADPRTDSDTPLDPAEFVLSLVEEVGPEAALPPEDWAYIAGVRFEQRVLTPLLADRFRVAAIVVASAMAVLDVLLFWGLWRLRRGKRPAKPAEKKKQSGTLSPAHLGSSPEKSTGTTGAAKPAAASKG